MDQGPCHIYRMTESSYIGVCCLPDRPSEKVGVTITIVSNDVDGWHQFLVGKGVEFVKAPSHSAEFGVYSSLFVSPHGYRIEIQCFDDAEWESRKIG